MKTKIVFDLDQVIRELGATINKRFNIPKNLEGVWWSSYKGKDFYDIVKEDLSVLIKSPTTSYYKIIKSFIKNDIIELWTHQPKEWQAKTITWLGNHFGDDFKVFFLNGKEKYNKLKKNPNILLVEDSPFFPDYSQIILIDKEYNKHCKAKIRVKSPKELKNILETIK